MSRNSLRWEKRTKIFSWIMTIWSYRFEFKIERVD
jgi:hypothetical protein